MAIIRKKPRSEYPVEVVRSGTPKYILRLFVSGVSQNSVRAIKNINGICEQYLKGDCALEIIDIYQQPALAIEEQIVVIPVMLIKFPLPERRIIGDLSDIGKVLEILNYK